MKTIELQQGTPAWEAWRARVFGASDCAAMLGISPYKSRDALLKEKASGEAPAPSDYLQAIFEEGHKAEAAARPLVEKILGEPLFSLVAESDDGALAASFDGITFDGLTVFEHKLLRDSDASRARFADAQAGKLAPHDMAQVQQQLMVSGAERCFFVVSDGTGENMAIAVVKPDETFADSIREGWAQFAADLKAYREVETDAPEWTEAAARYLDLGAQIKALEAAQKEERKKLEAYAKASGAAVIKGGGITASRLTRQGNVDYAAIPELAGVDLDAYRKAPTTYWKIA